MGCILATSRPSRTDQEGRRHSQQTPVQIPELSRGPSPSLSPHPIARHGRSTRGAAGGHQIAASAIPRARELSSPTQSGPISSRSAPKSVAGFPGLVHKMQGGRGGRPGLFGFGNPFPGFDDPFAGFCGFGRPGSLMSSFFGGANPFDDPFFTNPFGSMMQPRLLGPSMFGPQGPLNRGMNNAGMFGSTMFGPQTDLNQGMSNSGGFIQQAPEPSRPKGPIIKELSSDDEDDTSGDKEDDKNEGNLRKHPRTSQGPYVEEPNDEAEGNKRPKHGHIGREFSRTSTSHPQPRTFMFQSSAVSYGGPNGACYTSSMTRRTGGDGITLEEHKEADTATGKATHKIARGIGNKGHSLTRNLNSDGHVNTLQTLHNLNQDELAGFEETWQRNAGGNLPGWDPRINMLGSGNALRGIRDVNQMSALPAPDQSRGSNSSRNSQNGFFMGHSRHT